MYNIILNLIIGISDSPVNHDKQGERLEIIEKIDSALGDIETLLALLLGLISLMIGVVSLWYAKRSSKDLKERLKEQGEEYSKALSNQGEEYSKALNKQGEEHLAVLNKQSERLEKQSEILDEQSSTLDRYLIKFNDIMENLSTRHINKFPDNFDEIEQLLSCCNHDSNIQNRRKITIYTDVLGYGILSKNLHWNKLYKTMKEIIDNNKKVDVEWHFYETELRNEKLTTQFSIFKPENDPQNERLKYIKQVKSFAACDCDNKYPNCGRIKCDKYIIQSLDDNCGHEDLTACCINLQNNIEKDIEAISSKNPHLKKVCRVEKEFPFFGWFILERINGDYVPKKTIITYPNYIGNTENGLYTENTSLLQTHYTVLNEIVKQHGTTFA